MLARFTSLGRVSSPRNLLKVTSGAVRHVNSSGRGKTASEGSSFRGPVTYTSLALMAFIGGGVLIYYNTQKEEKLKKVASNVTTVGKAALGGPFILVDADGTPVSDAHYRGKFLLLYFGFTHCPDICPSELVKIGKIMDALERKKCTALKPIFISVDPARDTIGQLKLYGRDFHKDITYLTGAPGQVAAAAKAYRVYFSKAMDVDLDNEEEYLVDHSIVLYLVSPSGEFMQFFTQRVEVSDIVDQIEHAVKQYKPESK